MSDILDKIAEQIGELTEEQDDEVLDKIAEQIGELTEEQDDEANVTRTFDDDDEIPRRNLNEYDGAHDPEGRSDREQ